MRHHHDYPPATEHEWCRFLLAEAKRAGLLGYWHPDSRRAEGHRGYPDLTLLGDRGVLFAEVKMAGASTSADQDMWAWQLMSAIEAPGKGIRYTLWTMPWDWDSGLIQREMGELSQ
jgi:hypothetical protein